MFSCPNCGYKTETVIELCPVCGARMVNDAAQQPAYAAQQPAYAAPQAPAYSAPQAPETPAYGAPAYGAPAYGAPQAPEAPAYGAPTYGAPAYGAPTAPVGGVSKGKEIAGGIIAISGFAMAIFNFLFTMIAFSTEETGLALAMSIGFGIFSIPLSLVGLILCAGAAKAGSASGLVKAGKILGLIGTIISGVCLLFGFISLTFEDPYTRAMNDLYDAYSNYY